VVDDDAARQGVAQSSSEMPSEVPRARGSHRDIGNTGGENRDNNIQEHIGRIGNT